MNKEMLKELNDLRKELEISKEDFITILKIVFIYQKKYNNIINDEQLYQLVQEILVNIDINIEDSYIDEELIKSKTIDETLKKVLRNYNYH